MTEKADWRGERAQQIFDEVMKITRENSYIDPETYELRQTDGTEAEYHVRSQEFQSLGLAEPDTATLMRAAQRLGKMFFRLDVAEPADIAPSLRENNS